MTRSYVALNAQGERVVYRDQKRLFWLLSLSYPLLPLLGLALHAWTSYEIMLGVPLFLSHGLIPFLDWLVGEDVNNPPEDVVPQLEQDRYYRWLTWATYHFILWH